MVHGARKGAAGRVRQSLARVGRSGPLGDGGPRRRVPGHHLDLLQPGSPCHTGARHDAGDCTVGGAAKIFARLPPSPHEMQSKLQEELLADFKLPRTTRMKMGHGRRVLGLEVLLVVEASSEAIRRTW